MAVSIGIAAVGAGLAIYGAVKNAQAEKKAKQNLANRPVYTPLPEDDSQLNLAESQANQGMGAGARQALLNNSQASESTATNSILMGGGDANSISQAVNNSQTGLNNIATYDDQVRQQHVNTLLSTYNQYANQRQANYDKQFQINKYAPWADQQQFLTAQMGADQKTTASGLSLAAKGASGIKGGAPDNPDDTTGIMGSNLQPFNGQGVDWAPGYGPNASSGYNGASGFSAGAGGGMDEAPGISPFYAAGGMGNQYA